MPDLLRKLFFTIFEPPNRGNLHRLYCGPPLQLTGRGRISREGALDVRESRERHDNFSETAVFSGEFSFFWPRKN